MISDMPAGVGLPGWQCDNAVWAADGARVVFTCATLALGANQSVVWEWDAATGVTRQLASAAVGTTVALVRFTPDGGTLLGDSWGCGDPNCGTHASTGQPVPQR